MTRLTEEELRELGIDISKGFWSQDENGELTYSQDENCEPTYSGDGECGG